MLAGLPDDFRPLVMAVENSKETLTVDMVKHLLLQDVKFDCSGATNHMTNDRSFLHDERSTNNKVIVIANNSQLCVERVGDVEMRFFDEKGQQSVTVKNVGHVPGLCANLLSVSQMTKSGKKVIFEQNKCKIFTDANKLIATATCEDGFYRIDGEAVPKQKSVFIANHTPDLWHRRLAHICESSMVNVENSCLGVTLEKGKTSVNQP